MGASDDPLCRRTGGKSRYVIASNKTPAGLVAPTEGNRWTNFVIKRRQLSFQKREKKVSERDASVTHWVLCVANLFRAARSACEYVQRHFSRFLERGRIGELSLSLFRTFVLTLEYHKTSGKEHNTKLTQTTDVPVNTLPLRRQLIVAKSSRSRK